LTTFVDAACYTDGEFVTVDDREAVSDARLCNECFDECQSVADIPADWELCRTYSRAHNTCHRIYDDVGKRLTHGGHEYSGYEEAHTTLSEMEPEEFERRVLGKGGDA